MELDRLKDEFLAVTSHELKTPLQGIISISESLIRGAEGPLLPNQINNLDLIAKRGRRLTHLIHDLLDFSRLKRGDIRLNIKHVHLRPCVEFVLQVCQQMHRSKPIEWKLDLPSSLPSVWVDENRLVQILYNLIGNAAKFTDQGEI